MGITRLVVAATAAGVASSRFTGVERVPDRLELGRVRREDLVWELDGVTEGVFEGDVVSVFVTLAVSECDGVTDAVRLREGVKEGVTVTVGDTEDVGVRLHG